MSIFDNMSPDQISELLANYPNTGPPGMTSAYPNTPPPGRGSTDPYMNLPPVQGKPEPPKMPSSFKPGDVSGFANYGMTPPPLENPMQQISGLMGMMPNQNQPKQRSTMPQGGLMAYLQSLGV